ncbi:MAG TPA: hypothetical protein VGG68_11785 [Caulobacteraceae bacterium]
MKSFIASQVSRLVIIGLVGASLAGAALAQTPPASQYRGLTWRGIGPYRGGRAVAVTGVSSKPDTFYFGGVAGGVWKSANAGANWTPIFDGEPNGSIGAIAVAPSNPDILYVGTGEGDLRGDVTYGNGVYKTVDGGKTWSHIGLADSRQIGAVIVDPHDPNIVLVAAIGHAFGPNPERGVFRSADGGATWTKVLYKDPDTGAIDVVFDPSNSKVVYAALWQVRRQPWSLSSGGPGSGLYRSEDGGLTWTRLAGHGLPEGILGRIDVSVSGADPKRIYAMIEARDGGLYRSDDGGASWKRVSDDGRLTQRAWYFSKTYADPTAVDTVYVLNTGMLKSVDGGKTFSLVAATHGDHHGLWIDPADDNRLINANDGGASVSLDGGKTWSTQNNQPTAQFYHVAVDNRFPYWVYGAQQDNSNLTVASYDDEGVIGPRDWYPAGGGESGFVVPDPRNPAIIYSDAEDFFTRFDKRSEQGQDVSPEPVDNSGHPASELDHRFNWTSPLMLSPHDPDTLYGASEVVWKSTDHGMSWKIISPDLTRNDRTKQVASGGPLTKDITSVEYYDTIFALSESPLKRGLLWVGTDDGLVQTSLDDGGHWADVTPKDMPPWSTVSMVEPSPYDPGGAYVAVDRHRLDDIKPYAWKTADGGKTWTSIVSGIPDGAFVHVIREDPVRRGLLYAGTELGVFVSFDDGASWRSLQLNLPVSPVHDLVVKGDDLVAATHGRAFWILTDLTPLRQAGGADAGDLTLYTPQTAVRLHYPDQVDSRRPVGENPPAGAIIDYVLKADATSELTLDVVDAQGKVVRHLSSTKTSKEVQPPEWPDQLVPHDLIPAKAGMNRLVWDLRMNDPAQIPGAFYSGSEPRGPLVAPGRYELRLTLNGVTRTAPLTVIADPRVPGSEAAIAAKTALAVATVADIDALHRAVNEVRAARHAIATSADKALDPQLASIEAALMQVNMKGSEANLNFPGMLNEQYATFAGTIDDADTAPTAQEVAMFNQLHARLAVQLSAWSKLKAGPLANLKVAAEH